jgi:serine/threonine protein kinase
MPWKAGRGGHGGASAARRTSDTQAMADTNPNPQPPLHPTPREGLTPFEHHVTADNSSTQPDRPRANGFEPPPEHFGDYELIAEVARGGMGVVYRARQVTLGRVVALKMILAGRFADDDDVERFHREAEAAARLQHPNIVAIFEIGEIRGQHFFSMEFIDGVSLARKIAAGPLPGRAAAGYVRKIAHAVNHAHRQGIVHRDLKPSNVLLDADDEPHISDFGLAKRIGGDPGHTRTGTVLGTPSYMAPEQAQGRRDIGPPADIYGLGAILYELITGRPPFQAETPLDTAMQVIQNQPVPPRLLNPRVDHDLETICLKCLEKDPQHRYPSADAFADDLQHYLDGESISARSFNVLDRLARTLERSQHDADFSAWSSMLLWMALVIGIEHVIVFVLMYTGQPKWAVNAARLLQFAFLGVLFYANRRSRLLPSTSAERELWTIWIGYFLTYVSVLAVTYLLFALDVLKAGDHMPDNWPECLPYPFLSLVAGLAFFVMGSNYWGRCYIFGGAFWACAILMPLQLTLAPLAFGLLWFTALLMLGLRLRQLSANAVAAADNSAQVATVLFEEKK